MRWKWVDVAIVVTGLAGLGFMVASAFSDVSSMIGIALCGVASTVMLLKTSRERNAAAADD